MSGPERERLVADLARAKAVFQLGTVKAVICETPADDMAHAAQEKGVG